MPYLFLFAVFFISCALSPITGYSAEQRQLSYLQHIELIKSQSPDADFLGLRMAYTNTDEYTPISETADQYGPLLFKALGTKNYSECIRQADNLLAFDYTSLNAHYSAWVCNEDSGNQVPAEYHRYVLKGLIDSIRNSGNGQSKETAYVMISNAETVAFLGFQGLEIVEHLVIETDGKSFDTVQVKNQETGELSEVTFDITQQANWAATDSKP